MYKNHQVCVFHSFVSILFSFIYSLILDFLDCQYLSIYTFLQSWFTWFPFFIFIYSLILDFLGFQYTPIYTFLHSWFTWFPFFLFIYSLILDLLGFHNVSLHIPDLLVFYSLSNYKFLDPLFSWFLFFPIYSPLQPITEENCTHNSLTFQNESFCKISMDFLYPFTFIYFQKSFSQLILRRCKKAPERQSRC